MKNIFRKLAAVSISITIMIGIAVFNSFEILSDDAFVKTTFAATERSEVKSVDEIFFDMLLQESSASHSQIKSDTLWDVDKGEERGQNLYLAMRSDSEDAPLKAAIRKASQEISLPHAKTGSNVFFSEDEWRQIYIARNSGALIKNLGLNNSAILNEYSDAMIEYVEDEISNNEFTAELMSDSAGSEVATAMLIPDMEIMELILFGEVKASEYDNARISVGLPPLSTYAASESSDTAEIPVDGEILSETSSVSSSIRAPADQSFVDDTREFPNPNGNTSSDVLYNPTGLNPLQCNSDTNIDDALDDYFGELPNGNPFEDLIPNKGDGDDFDNSNTDSSSDGGSGVDSDGNYSGNSDLNTPEDDFDDIEAAAEHDWEVGNLCNDIFCIEIIFANDEDGGGVYRADDNCIACHMQFMLENMDTLLSKTLTPSKAPGNLMESGKCKKGFLQVSPSLNIYAIKKPIPSPNDNDAIFQSSNPFESFQREITEGYGFGKGGRVDASTRHIVQFSEGRSTSSIFAEVDDATVTRQKELDFNREMVLLQQDLNMYAQGYGDVSSQLEQLNSLISAVDEMVTDINETSCESLRGKKTCE